MALPTENQMEQLADGLTRHYLHHGQIVVFTFENIHQHTMDAWTDAVRNGLAVAPADRPYLSIYNFLPVENPSFTPYTRKKASELTPLMPNIKGRTALIMRRSLVSQIVSLFLRTQGNQARKRQVFFKLEDGIKWCEELLKEPISEGKPATVPDNPSQNPLH